jgi:lysophospholipase L1-like esterase
LMRVVAACAVAAALGSAATSPPSAFAATPWIGTWAASPQTGSTTFNKQTLRQIVHTSISGSAARVQLSNVFGSQPLTVSDVHIALRTSGSSVATSTDRQITFGGSASVTIPAGGTAVSDSAGFSASALADVAVSFYLPQQTGAVTYHSTGEQTNYIAAGDVSGNGSLTGPATSNDYYVLANLDVQNTAAEGSAVVLGASIVDGVASSANTNNRWPDRLATRLADSGRPIGVLNQGISGNRLLVDGSGQSAANRFDRDVLSQPGVKWVIFADDPINDLLHSSPTPSGSQLTTALQQLISRAHAKSVKFLCSTLTPAGGTSGWTAAAESGRQTFNTFVRSANSGCDGVIDQDTATHDPANPTHYLPAYDSGDHLHPNNAGMQAIANAIGDWEKFDLIYD